MMARAPDEEPDLKLVEELVFRVSGIALRRFDRAETLAGRTPDFRVLRGSTLSAFCEVKSPRDDWLDEQIEAAPPGDIAGGARADSTFNRLARHIEKGATQFDAVNGGHALPNVLAFVNHADATGPADLIETVTGTFYADDGSRFATMRHISEGRIGVARTRVDLFVWSDAKTRRVRYLFNAPNVAHVRTICDLLGFDSAKIKAI